MSKVFIRWLHPEMHKASLTESLLGLLAYDTIVRVEEGKPRQIASLLGHQANVNISTPRNEVVRQFLAQDVAEWALLIDADMVFPPDSVERLLDHADPDKAPIVGGLCFGASDGGVLWPTLYELTELEDGPAFVRYTDFPLTPQLLRVAGTGAAFLMVHRKVFEAIRDKGFNKAYPWFQETELGGGPLGEDLTFCLRAGICGFPIHVLTSLHIGHVKPTLLNAYRYFQQEGRVVDPPPEGSGQTAPPPKRPKSPSGADMAVTVVPS